MINIFICAKREMNPTAVIPTATHTHTHVCMYTHTPGNPAPGACRSGEGEAMAARHLSKAEGQSVVVVGGCPSPSLHQEGKGV